MKTTYDVIVIGVGSMGSATCYYLAKRGFKVLGIEQFKIAHEFGSHAGQSRIIRKAYFEHPGYVPLLERAYENWKALEQETGEHVYFKTGLLYSGSPDNPIIKGVKQSAALYNLELVDLQKEFVEQQYPQFSFPEDFEILFEPDAGFLPPEKSIQLYTASAMKYGATIHTEEKITGWEKKNDLVIVETDKGTYQSKKLVITAGAWAGKMIPGFADKIKVTRQFVAWIKQREAIEPVPDNFPCWMIADESKKGCYYGFPLVAADEFGSPEGLKLAHHYPFGETVPDNPDRDVTEEDVDDLTYCLNKYMPGVFETVLSSKVCLYANSPDENFIIDHLPGYDGKVSIACGFSGHGFKFASVVGEILADLATDGKTNLPIEFLNAKRFN